MAISDSEYGKMAKKASPPTKKAFNCIMAFISGGFICAGAEALRLFYISRGLNEAQVKALVPVTIIAITALLTATGIFDSIAYYAGAGTFVPITGFANSVVSPAMEFQSEGRILGTGANMFKIAGPVIVYGTASAVIYGLAYFLVTKE